MYLLCLCTLQNKLDKWQTPEFNFLPLYKYQSFFFCSFLYIHVLRTVNRRSMPQSSISEGNSRTKIPTASSKKRKNPNITTQIMHSNTPAKCINLTSISSSNDSARSNCPTVVSAVPVPNPERYVANVQVRDHQQYQPTHPSNSTSNRAELLTSDPQANTIHSVCSWWLHDQSFKSSQTIRFQCYSQLNHTHEAEYQPWKTHCVMDSIPLLSNMPEL